MSIQQIVEEAYAAYSDRNIDRTMQAFADDVIYDWPVNPETAAFSGRIAGREAMLERLSELDQAFEFLSFRMVDLVTEGDKAAARVVAQLRSRSSGADITVHMAHFWRFEEGRCAEFTEYYDSALLSAHMK